MAEIPAGSKLVFIDADVPTRELKSSRSNSKTEVYTIEDIAETVGGGSDYTETIVNITPTETTYSDGRPLFNSGILSMGTTPIELLPVIDDNLRYYEVDKVIIEFTNGSVEYSFANLLELDYSSNWYVSIEPTLITSNEKKIYIIKDLNRHQSFEFIQTYPSSISYQGLWLGTQSGNPTGGDGTLRVKIYHKTITFGA
jgi:hypothetical protein